MLIASCHNTHYIDKYKVYAATDRLWWIKEKFASVKLNKMYSMFVCASSKTLPLPFVIVYFSHCPYCFSLQARTFAFTFLKFLFSVTSAELVINFLCQLSYGILTVGTKHTCQHLCITFFSHNLQCCREYFSLTSKYFYTSALFSQLAL